MATARRRATRVVAALVALPAVAAGTGCEPACPEPYGPVASQIVSYNQPTRGEWPIPDSLRPPSVGPLDSDGDGVADEVTWTAWSDDEPQRVIVRRGSGDLVVVLPLRSGTAYVTTMGDLDGDGHDEFAIDVQRRDVGRVGRVVVRGSLPDGEHALDDVGVTPIAPATDDPRPVGDVDGDGRDDLTTYHSDTETAVWLAADLDLSPGGPGATEPSLVVPGTHYGSVPLDGRDALILVTHRPTEERNIFEVALWLPEFTWRFTSEGGLQGRPSTFIGAYPAIVESGTDRWLTIDFGGLYETDRYAWDLDDLCAAA